MNEPEWLACGEPRKMLRYLEGKATDRKLRLFACACCRRIWHLLPHQSNRDLVAAVEDHPAGAFSDPDLEAAIVASSRHESQFVVDQGYWAVKYLGRSYYKLTPFGSAVAVAFLVARRARAKGEAAAEEATQASLVREGFGNPFCQVTLDPSWLVWNSGTIPKLAQSIYDDRAFERLPILADALEEAGCTDPAILDHCRNQAEHARGCWVVDLILAKG